MRSNASAVIRLSATLAMLALATACDRAPAPAAPAPVAASAPVAAPATVAAPAAPSEQVFSTDDARIGSEVGERSLGQGLSTTGKAGWLVFGPYVPLPAGRYQVALQGAVHEGHAGVVYVDVARGKGTEILATTEVDAPALASPPSPDGLVVLPFTLASDATDLEIRVRVTDASKLSLTGYAIRAVP